MSEIFECVGKRYRMVPVCELEAGTSINLSGDEAIDPDASAPEFWQHFARVIGVDYADPDEDPEMEEPMWLHFSIGRQDRSYLFEASHEIEVPL